MGDLTTHFSRHEFQCHCGCGFWAVDPSLLAILTMMRDRYGKAITITSGARCKIHNAAVGGEENSEHLTGLAVDIEAKNSTDRARLMILAIGAGIKRFGIADTFIHIGSSQQHPSPRIWLY